MVRRLRLLQNVSVSLENLGGPKYLKMLYVEFKQQNFIFSTLIMVKLIISSITMLLDV